MNLLTEQKICEGFDEVREYRAFSLGLPLTLPGGNELNANRLPPVHRPNLRAGQPNSNCEIGQITPGATDVLNDDLVVLHPQYSTQWDALVHAGSLFDADGDGVPEAVYYNGYRAHNDVIGEDSPQDCGVDTTSGQPLRSTADYGPLGIQSLAEKPVQGRAVMIDLAAHFGTDHRVIGWSELSQVIEADGVDVRAGDIVLIHTGFAENLVRMNGSPTAEGLHQFGAVLDGRDVKLLDWITRSEVAAIAADNNAVELYPARQAEPPFAVLPLHEHCLFKLGVPLAELWYLTELADHLRSVGRTACLITAPPLNLPGAAGSPLNPIATV
ncbi:cyclase family protein [Citricoccus sp. NR2]|uniref:cyclase family protein n=1 Tax=Citricoccus sp. NR2 TaxID=3004095 RepID=UPI0022DE02FA|nr:cyclase family protein [Citricoccus sp. NR2]WBL19482.1 cyclase family protein [Citricoccus sp. NR2]